MRVNASFSFNSVGQGLFYSGILNVKADGKKEDGSQTLFSFVYDCGSTSDKRFLYRRIDDFKALLGPKRNVLDLLVISHLHEDHINGLDYLLHGMRVKTVILPYITDELKLMAALSASSEDENIIAFYRDPVSWLFERGADNIVMIDPEREPLNESINEKDFGLIETNRYQIVEPFWQFLFGAIDWVKDREYSEAVRFLRAQAIYDLRDLSIKSLRELRRELMSKFNELNINGELNRTSVIALHMPVTDRCALYGPKGLEFCCGNARTLLTGDVLLKKGESLPFNDQIDKGCVAICQYPHHGSDLNNMGYFIDLVARKYVISYGLTNRYMHPGKNVIYSVPALYHVNETNAFDYQIFTDGSLLTRQP